jgi:hypothetical protein
VKKRQVFFLFVRSISVWAMEFTYEFRQSFGLLKRPEFESIRVDVDVCLSFILILAA